MLTKDQILKAVEGLTEDQIQAIANLSKSDEDRIVGEKFKEFHDRVDGIVSKITGKGKPDGVQTTANLESVLQTLNEKAQAGGDVEQLQTKLSDLERERDALKAKAKAGGGPADLAKLEQRLQDKEGELLTFKKEREEISAQLKAATEELHKTKIGQEIDTFLLKKGVKFKDTIPETVLQETLENRRIQLLQGIKADQIDDGQGGKKTVLRDNSGEILRNPANAYEPFTAGELYLARVKDLISEGQQQTGAGTKGGNGANGKGLVNISSAKTQIEANEAIVRHLMESEGLSNLDPELAKRQKEVYLEHKEQISALPLR